MGYFICYLLFGEEVLTGVFFLKESLLFVKIKNRKASNRMIKYSHSVNNIIIALSIFWYFIDKLYHSLLVLRMWNWYENCRSWPFFCRLRQRYCKQFLSVIFLVRYHTSFNKNRTSFYNLDLSEILYVIFFLDGSWEYWIVFLWCFIMSFVTIFTLFVLNVLQWGVIYFSVKEKRCFWPKLIEQCRFM